MFAKQLLAGLTAASLAAAPATAAPSTVAALPTAAASAPPQVPPPPLPPAPPAPPAPFASAALAPARSAAPAKAYFALYDAIFSGIDMQIMAHNAAEAVVGQIVKRDPAMVRLERRRPQFPARLAGAIAPYFALWMSRVKLQRRGEGAAIMAHHLLPAQAQRAADFYGSPLGQRMMRVMAGNLTMDSLLQSKLEPGTITRAEGQDRDIKRAMIKTLPDFIATLSPAERRQIAQLGKDPLFAKVNAASAELMRQPDPEFSKFGTPAEMAAIKTAIDQVVTEELAAS